ncbi:MAG: hypothetical protein VX335_00855 [Pseudomonadota bacterium]|nr:hypothetical protein [Pseudomonadota bacterium]
MLLTSSRLRAVYADFVTFVVSLIPVFKSCPPCPICMPKYAAIFAFFGLELADYSDYLVPIMLVALVLSLGSMYYQIVARKLNYYPFGIALSSCLCLLLCKYYFASEIGSYFAMGGLLIGLVIHYRSLNMKCCNSSNCTS